MSAPSPKEPDPLGSVSVRSVIGLTGDRYVTSWGQSAFVGNIVDDSITYHSAAAGHLNRKFSGWGRTRKRISKANRTKRARFWAKVVRSFCCPWRIRLLCHKIIRLRRPGWSLLRTVKVTIYTCYHADHVVEKLQYVNTRSARPSSVCNYGAIRSRRNVHGSICSANLFSRPPPPPPPNSLK